MKMNKICLVYILILMAQGIGAALGSAEENQAVHPRIISLYAGHTEILLRLGARDHLVGISAHETYDGPETEGWDRPPVFSLQDDVEKYLLASPDIIVLRPFHVAAGSRLVEMLEASGIKLKSLQVLHPDDLYPYWRTLAEIVGQERAGEQMITEFDQVISAYRQAAAQRLDQDKPGIFIEAIHRQIKTFTADSLPYWIVQLAGGRNVTVGTKSRAKGQIIADYGLERLLAIADQVDIFISQEGVMNQTPLEQITNRKIYQPLGAMREGKVYKIPERYLARPTPSLLVGLREIGGLTGLEVPVQVTWPQAGESILETGLGTGLGLETGTGTVPGTGSEKITENKVTPERPKVIGTPFQKGRLNLNENSSAVN